MQNSVARRARIAEQFDDHATEQLEETFTGSRAVSEAIVRRIVGVLDGISVFAAGAVATHWASGGLDWRMLALAVPLGTLLAINFLHLLGAYGFDRFARLEDGVSRVLAAWLLALGTLGVVAYFATPIGLAGGSWLTLWFTGGLSLLLPIRLVLFHLVRKWRREGRLGELVAIVGAGPIAQRLLRRLNASGGPAMRIVGVYDDDAASLPRRCMGHPIRGTVEDLVREARQLGIGTVIVAMPLAVDRALTDTMNKLALLPVDVRLCPDAFGLGLGQVEVSHLGGLTFLNVIDRPLRDWQWIAKEIEDRVLAAVILVLISPLMLAVAALIKLDSPGPVFFRQKRYGFNNRLIEIWKFRTMHHAARDDDAEQLTRRNDPRITRIGAFLRRTSIDELPQFINVLRGDMSIVGPRPHAPRAKAGTLLYTDAIRYYDARHRVKPGITGWAQVNGWRGETDTVEQIRKRVEHDLHYIDNWSIRLDLKIIARTALGGFTGHHAF
ncbi:MAG: undecaprenyl-phosphate glucose phosphotransferase [Alphaproteobacteria bacterium]|nr:undecaprenyl-phosphate glucose phosphotransferase [Alphaproteobacteria bacterium]MCW5738688.1 undecaprenyl-phosphate glucose phosphotransferase [Alphaproteobacteria bacterium]